MERSLPSASLMVRSQGSRTAFSASRLASGTISEVDGSRAPSCTSHPCHSAPHLLISDAGKTRGLPLRQLTIDLDSVVFCYTAWNQQASKSAPPPVHGRGLTVDSPQTTASTVRNLEAAIQAGLLPLDRRPSWTVLTLSSLPRARPRSLHRHTATRLHVESTAALGTLDEEENAVPRRKD